MIAVGPLLTGAASLNSPADQVQSYNSQIIILPDKLYMEVITVYIPETLSLYVQSNVSINVYIMNNDQYTTFVSTGIPGSMYSASGTNISKMLDITSGGFYFLVMDDDISSEAVVVTYNYAALPLPAFPENFSLPVPTGIADYGIENISGTLIPYDVLTNEVVGYTTIYSMSAFNGSSQSGASPYGASLQMNAVLEVNTTNGNYVYWLQDVAEFVTNHDTLSFSDNIWNYSAVAAPMNKNYISGSGSVIHYKPLNTTSYGYGTRAMAYAFPLSFTLPITVSSNANGVSIIFGYQFLSNGRDSNEQNQVNYDVVTIHDPGVISASILVSGYNKTPSGNYYDAELVFGGEYNGQVTTFTSMDSTLNLNYRIRNGSLVEPPSIYIFGSDTAEAAYNLEVALVNSMPTVIIGKLDLSQSYYGQQITNPYIVANYINSPTSSFLY